MESPTKQQRQQQQLLQLSPAQLGSLERHGMRLDELNRVRVIDEETENHAQALRDVCNEFIRDTTDFQKIADSFINIFNSVSAAVEREKIQAIGARNLLKGYAKERSSQTQQLAALVREKQQQHERLQQYYSSLLRREAQQQEFMDQFILHK